MTMWLGDFAVGATVDFMWSSNGADGASITRSTNGTINVYKGNGTTQSTAGVTDTEDFDSLTGIHHCRITTASDGTFYAAANNFTVVLSGATIDGKSVNAVLAHFSIQNRYAPSIPSASAIADAVWDEARTGHTTAGTFGLYLDGQVTTAGPSAATIADAVWDEPETGHLTALTFGSHLANAAVDNLGNPTTVYDEAGSVGKALVDFLADPGAGGGGGGDITAIDGSTVAADNLRKWFDGTGYNAAASAVGTAAAVTGTVNAKLVSINGDAAAFDKFLNMVRGAVVGLVGAGTNTTTVVTAVGLSATADFYVGKTFIATTGTNAGQGGKLVTDYDGATKRLTIEALTAPMSVGDLFVLVG